MPSNYSGDGTAWVTSVPVPADGEDIDEKICAPAWKANADRAAYLKRVLPTLYHWTHSTVSAFFTYSGAGALQDTESVSAYVDVPSCVVGDKISIAGFLSLLINSNVSNAFDLWIDVIEDAAGTPGTQTHVDGARWQASNGLDTNSAGVYKPVALQGTWTVTEAGTCRFMFAFQRTTTGGDSATFNGGASLIATRHPAL